MKVASQLWTDWTDCVMDWIGWMVTLKAISGWMDGLDWMGWDGYPIHCDTKSIAPERC